MIDFTIVCPKGDLAKDAESFLYKKFGIKIDLNSRKYVQEIGKCRIVIMRCSDVPQVTEQLGDYGITGKDIFRDYILRTPKSKLKELENLDFGYTRVAVLGRRRLKKLTQLIRVATPYEALTKNFLKNLGYEVVINNSVKGSLEALIDLGLADVVVDVVNSGRTSKENNLVELYKVLDSNAILIGR